MPIPNSFEYWQGGEMPFFSFAALNAPADPDEVLQSAGGTYHAPSVGEVIDTAVFGPSSGTAGTFAIPAETDVKAGVGYGEDGTEFLGEYAGGGSSVPVVGGNVVRR